jgi:hypothetical protein
MPPQWNALWEMLPNRRRVGDGWEPALPLILGAWHETPVVAKINRLREHIEWAEQHNILDQIARFLRTLQESQWAHAGEHY